MRKFTMAALVAVFAMVFSTMVYAAPSPTAGTITVVVPGKQGASAAEVKAADQKQLTALAGYIAESAASMGMTASVKTAVSIVAPKDYKGGDIPTVIAVSGLANGAKNVFAYILLPNGKTVIVPCTVKNGYVGFVAPAFGTVSIVEMTPSVQQAAAAASAAATAPAKLH